MSVRFETEKIGPRTFVVGYASSKDGPDLPEVLDGIRDWRDDFGNPLWELLEDGKVVPANFTPTTEQTDKHDKKQREVKVTGSFAEIVAEAIRSTNNANQSWEAIDAALRDILK